MPSLTFYGGVGEVGGNKVLLKDGDTRVLLDFGVSYTTKRRYYSEPFLSPRSERGLVELELLPKLSGLYRFDDAEPQVEAVFLSHSHLDHAGYVSFFKGEIPVWCGETTATILQALNDMKVSGLEYNFDGVTFKTFRTGDRIQLGSIEVQPIHVDHSVPGSYGFIVHTTSGSVVYTGDFRLHGTKPEMTEEFLSGAAEAEPVAVITEATNMTGAEPSSEPEVMGKLTSIVKDASGIVLADFARADVDRLRSFHQAAKMNGRFLALTLRQAYILERLSRDPHLKIPSLEDESILLFQKMKKRYYPWEQTMLKLKNIVDSAKVAEMQSRVILAASFYSMEELLEIKPAPGSCYVLSSSEPVDEEGEIEFEKLTNWLNRYGLPQYHVHVSGHILPFQLREALKAVGPRVVYPVHCDRPELFSKFIGDLKCQTVTVEKGREYTF